MTVAAMPLPSPSTRDVLEIRQYGSTWTVVLLRSAGMPQVSIADCETLMKAEQFARHVADVRGSTDVIVRRPA